MKNKFISAVALLVSTVAFFATIAFLVYRIQTKLSYSIVVFQLVLTGIIFLLCVLNFIYLFATDTKDSDEEK